MDDDYNKIISDLESQLLQPSINLGAKLKQFSLIGVFVFCICLLLLLTYIPFKYIVITTIILSIIIIVVHESQYLQSLKI